MKRLIRFFKAMETSNTTYREIYEGPRWDPVLLEVVSDPTYWEDEVAYLIERTHKTTLDRPCVTIQIPWESLGLPPHLGPEEELVITDLSLRQWVREVAQLNTQLENPARPDRENGAFYTYKPGNTRRLRNACFVQRLGEDLRLCLMVVIQYPVRQHAKAMRMTCKLLPRAVRRFIEQFPHLPVDIEKSGTRIVYQPFTVESV